MDENDWSAERFEAHRSHLRAVAYRMVGSSAEADDAVQDAWLRFDRSDTSDVENLGGWLTTVVARICLSMLRARDSRREDPLDGQVPSRAEPVGREATYDPEREALLADTVGHAMLVVLETLSPAERVAFVLHDLFDVSFDEIAPIVERAPAATRKLASRARQRVRGASAPTADLARQREVVDAFLAASRGGDFDALLALLDPDVVLRADAAAVLASTGQPGAPALAAEVHGPAAVAEAFSGRARAAQPALIDGAAGVVWAPGGQPRAVFAFTLVGGKVAAIDLSFDPESVRSHDVVLLTD